MQFTNSEKLWFVGRLATIAVVGFIFVLVSAWPTKYISQGSMGRSVNMAGKPNQRGQVKGAVVFAGAQAAGHSEYPSAKYAKTVPAHAPGDVPVLMYHHIADIKPGDDALRRGLSVSLSDFSAQLDDLQKMGYQSITVAQLYAHLSGSGTPATVWPAKPIILTFDDGYDDLFTNATPILVAHHMVGTFGIVTGFIGTPGYGTWDQVKSAKSQGMEMISHTYSHYDFNSSSATDQQREYEIVKAQLDLHEHLGGAIDSFFIYPYGHFNAVTEKILKSHGYVMAFTVNSGFVPTGNSGQNLLELPRVRVHGQESLQRFEENLK